MKLSTTSVQQLDLLVQTAMTAGIKKLIIEPGKIRGIDEKQTVVIITDANVPDLDGKQAGINRLEQLAPRLNLVKSQGDVSIDAVDAPNGHDISMFDLSCGKVKTQFRCASTESVKGVPKNTADVLVWEIKVSAKELPTIAQGVTAMGAETITFASRDGKTVSVECTDASKDMFTIDLFEPAAWIGNGNPGTAFCQKYSAKTMISLLKEGLKTQDPITLKLGEGGIFSFKVNGFDFFIIPLS